MAAEAIDTVVVAATDMQGRLVGKRMEGDFFLEQGAHEDRGAPTCCHRHDMNPCRATSLSRAPATASFRMVPTSARCGACRGSRERARAVRRPRPPRRPDRGLARGGSLTALASGPRRSAWSPLRDRAEFFLFGDSYAEAEPQGLPRPHCRRRPTCSTTRPRRRASTSPSSSGPTRHAGGGHSGRVLQGEAWPNQHEINLRYADARTHRDRHVVYKTASKRSPPAPTSR